jgi:hypothetical protein
VLPDLPIRQEQIFFANLAYVLPDLPIRQEQIFLMIGANFVKFIV